MEEDKDVKEIKSFADIMIHISKIEQTLVQMGKALQNIDVTLNDGKAGLKTRVALLEAAESSRIWRERFVIASLAGIIIKMIWK